MIGDWRLLVRRWSQRFVEADIEARWIVQREIYLNEEAQALRKSLELSADGKEVAAMRSQLSMYCEELQSLDQKYWDACRLRWKLEGDIPVGSLSRAFKAHRSNPDWYLCEWLRQDCAGRGGCCGRDCGCCEKPRPTHRDWNQGHCTSACGCCVRTRPNHKKNEQAKCNDVEEFPFDIVANKTSYSARISRAHIWGLSFLDELNLLEPFTDLPRLKDYSYC